ncbi:MAG TPA: hypothetical protein VG838_09715 [Opitutaceae bacterium]|nr:hypothetical protein [Opitutaceae bacterium]
MKPHALPFRPLLAAVIALAVAGAAYASGLATDITGLYYTGINNGGGLLAGGSTDSHWTVTYASTNGGTSANSTYEGAAYVVNNSNVVGSGWTQNSTSSQWIVAPGATDPNNGNSVNTGGDFLPGNGNTGSHEGIYVYTLAFTITGTGSGTVTNAVSIGLTISADDQYSIYVNPSGNGTTIPTGTASASGTSAWNNTASATLQNGTNGTNGNAQFKIGTNYLVIVVDNTNSVNGSSSSTATNASGLLVYQVGSAVTINGKPIPEEGTWLPLVAAVGLYGFFVWRRRQQDPVLV